MNKNHKQPNHNFHSIHKNVGKNKKIGIAGVFLTCVLGIYYYASRLALVQPFGFRQPVGNPMCSAAASNPMCSAAASNPTPKGETKKEVCYSYSSAYSNRSRFAALSMRNTNRSSRSSQASTQSLVVSERDKFANFGNIKAKDPVLASTRFQRASRTLSRCLPCADLNSLPQPQKNKKGIISACSTALQPPVAQFMQPRENSATQNYRATGLLKNISNDTLQTVLQKEKVYGAQCFSREQLKFPPTIEQIFQNSGVNTKNDDIIFPVYKPGANITVSKINLQKKVDAENVILQQKSENKKLVIFEHGQEKQGNQARFCIFLDIEKYRTEKVDVIVWKSNNNVKMLFLGHVPYDLKVQIQAAVKEEIPNFNTSLPNLKTINNTNWDFQSNLEFDHYIGSNDAAFIGLKHETAQTHILDKYHNRSRNMDPNNPNAASLATTLAQDQVYELLQQFDLNNEESPFVKYRKKTYKDNGELVDPGNKHAIPLDILVQLESSYFFHHLESSRTLEFKARCTRVDVQHLGDFTEADIEMFGLQKVQDPIIDGAEAIEYLMFELQKSIRNGNFVREAIKERINSLQGGNYNCKNWENMILVIDDLLETMKINVKHGNFECAILNLGGNNETKCLLDSTRLDISHINNLIHDSIDQIKLANSDLIQDAENADEKMKSISDKIEELRVNCEIEPEIKTVEQFRTGVQEMMGFDIVNTLYRNNTSQAADKFPISLKSLRNHVHDSLVIEAEKINSHRPPLTGIFGV